MSARFRFCKLDVWKKAIDYADAIYDMTSAFPDTERFGLTSQLRRASVSISSNIAEGCSRSSDRDFMRFVESRTVQSWRPYRNSTLHNDESSPRTLRLRNLCKPPKTSHAC